MAPILKTEACRRAAGSLFRDSLGALTIVMFSDHLQSPLLHATYYIHISDLTLFPLPGEIWNSLPFFVVYSSSSSSVNGLCLKYGQGLHGPRGEALKL